MIQESCCKRSINRHRETLSFFLRFIWFHSPRFTLLAWLWSLPTPEKEHLFCYSMFHCVLQLVSKCVCLLPKMGKVSGLKDAEKLCRAEGYKALFTFPADWNYNIRNDSSTLRLLSVIHIQFVWCNTGTTIMQYTLIYGLIVEITPT